MGPDTILLTGATGFVGRELLWRMARTPGTRVLCLVRGSSEEESARRLSEAIDHTGSDPLTPEQRSRVSACRGDLTADRLGLSASRWDQVAAEVTRIVHGAASVQWDLPLDQARLINFEGTRRMLELAEAAVSRGSLRKFDYLSTVHVCGRRQGRIGEEDLDDSHGFFSTYEQSKFEAEKLVRSRRGSIPANVFRLSMVVGDSRTGYASTFKVMYWPLKQLSRGKVRVVPADPQGLVDLVPVDYLCDAIEAISADPAQRGKGFHMAAGTGRAATILQMLELAAGAFHVRKPKLISQGFFLAVVRPILYAITWGKQRDVLKKAQVYTPYFSFRASFDTSQVRAALAGTGLEPPAVSDYFQKLIDYAVRSDWGKRDLGRPVAAGESQ